MENPLDNLLKDAKNADPEIPDLSELLVQVNEFQQNKTQGEQQQQLPSPQKQSEND